MVSTLFYVLPRFLKIFKAGESFPIRSGICWTLNTQLFLSHSSGLKQSINADLALARTTVKHQYRFGTCRCDLIDVSWLGTLPSVWKTLSWAPPRLDFATLSWAPSRLDSNSLSWAPLSWAPGGCPTQSGKIQPGRCPTQSFPNWRQSA